MIKQLTKQEVEFFLQKVKSLGGWPLLSEDWNENNFDWQETLDNMYSIGITDNFLLYANIGSDYNSVSHKNVIRINYHNYCDCFVVNEELKNPTILAYNTYMKSLITKVWWNR